jgi:hypothetical protein
LLKRKIDLLEQKAIKNPYLKQQIEKTKVLVYGKRNQDLVSRHQTSNTKWKSLTDKDIGTISTRPKISKM